METEELKILLAEDDPNLGKILKSYLDIKGYQAYLYTNGEDALNAFNNESFDFCIIDIIIPGIDGFTLAKEIREKNEKIPIVFLSAKSMEEDKKTAYGLGADDYITKPFSMDELILKIDAIARRCIPYIANNSNIFEIGNFTFDYVKQTLEIKNKSTKLTSRESDLLKLLCISKNDILDRRFALKKIWLDDSYFNARSMDVYIAKLRRYLKADPKVAIMNVHGIGFKLVDDFNEGDKTT